MKIEQLKVQSFVTSQGEETNALKGGSSGHKTFWRCQEFFEENLTHDCNFSKKWDTDCSDCKTHY